MIGVTKISSRNAGYWINAVAEGGDDYYTKPGEAPGYWAGSLAAELGLSGEVDPEAYARLLAGEDPGGGGPLVRRAAPRVFIDASGKERRLEPILGYDVRFSAPKSVSLLWALGSPEVQAEPCWLPTRRRSPRRSAYLEREACFVQRGKGGARIERGAGFVSMAFLHRSSRAGDPTLHTHLVTANMTRAVSDGRWLSLANPRSHSPLLREAKAAGYLYQAGLRAALTRELGVAWQEADQRLRRHSRCSIASDRALLAPPRRRSSASWSGSAWTRRRPPKSPPTAPAAPKDHRHASDAQREGWRSRAAEFGVGEASIEAALAGAGGREPRGGRGQPTSTPRSPPSRRPTRTSIAATCSARWRTGCARAAGAEELTAAVDEALDIRSGGLRPPWRGAARRRPIGRPRASGSWSSVYCARPA